MQKKWRVRQPLTARLRSKENVKPEARQSIILLIGTGITTVLSMLYSIYAARTLGPAVAADFFAALSLIAFGQIALGPINSTVTTFTAQFAAKSQYGKVRTLHRKIFRKVLFFGLLGIPLTAVTIKPLLHFLWFESYGPLAISFCMLFGLMLLSVARGVLRGDQQFMALNINTIIEAGSRLVIGVLILHWWTNAAAGLSAYVLALMITLLISQIQVKKIWAGHESSEIDGRAVLRFTGPMLILMAVSAGYQNIDMFCAKHYFSDVEAGLYGAAFTLARTISAVVTPFTTLLLPLLSSMYNQGKPLGGTFFRICGYFLLLAAVPMLLFGLWPQQIMQMLYGEAFTDAGYVLFTLAMARLVGYLCHMLALALAAMHRFRFLYLYVAGLVVLGVWLAQTHTSTLQIARICLIVEGVVLISMLIWMWLESARKIESPETPLESIV